MASSAVPRVLDALLAMLRGAAWPAALEIVDGPPGIDQSAPDRLYVGAALDDLLPAVSGNQEWPHLSVSTKDDLFTVVCVLQSWTGDTDPKAGRDRLFGYLAVVEAQLRSNVNLSGACLWCGLGAYQLYQRQTQEGLLMALQFDVAGRARI